MLKSARYQQVRFYSSFARTPCKWLRWSFPVDFTTVESGQVAHFPRPGLPYFMGNGHRRHGYANTIRGFGGQPLIAPRMAEIAQKGQKLPFLAVFGARRQKPTAQEGRRAFFFDPPCRVRPRDFGAFSVLWPFQDPLISHRQIEITLHFKLIMQDNQLPGSPGFMRLHCAPARRLWVRTLQMYSSTPVWLGVTRTTHFTKDTDLGRF